MALPRLWYEIERAPEHDDDGRWAYWWWSGVGEQEGTDRAAEGLFLAAPDGQTTVPPEWDEPLPPGTTYGLVRGITPRLLLRQHVKRTGERPEHLRWDQPERPNPGSLGSTPIQPRKRGRGGLGLGTLGERARRP